MNFLSKIAALAGISTPYVGYNTAPTGVPTSTGTTFWDVDDDTLDIIMNGTTQKVGEDIFYAVKNQTGSTIPKGTAVRFAGTVGNSGRLLIAPFLANGTYPSKYFMGVTSADIANGANGYVYQFGRCKGIDTTAYAEGTILYASTTVAGGFQTTAPQAPNNIVTIAAVVSSATNGILFVRPSIGSNINEDEGVKITSVANNNILAYDSAQSLWINNTVAGVLGYTPIGGTGTTNFLPKFTGSTTLANSQIFDNGTNVGIGNTNTAFKFDVTGTARISTSLQVANNRSVVLSDGSITIKGSTGGWATGLTFNGSAGTAFGGFGAFGGTDALTYLWIGDAYNVTAMRIFPTTNNVSVTTNLAIGLSTPASALHIDKGNATASYLQFTAGTTTGQTANDGFDVGIDSSGNAILNQQEALAMIFSTSATERMRLSASGNLGLGVTPSAWGSSFKSIDIGTNGASLLSNGTADARLYANAYFDGTNWVYKGSSVALGYQQANTGHFWYSASSGTGGGTISWNTLMTINNAGSVGIGTTSLTNSNLRISKNITGSVQTFTLNVDGQIQADVTTEANLIRTQSNQIAGATLTDLNHFAVNQGTISGTLTSQTGFVVGNLTSGTNIFGFKGNLSSGTGKWNLYMGGSADNYLAGRLGIGTTSISAILSVVGASQMLHQYSGSPNTFTWGQYDVSGNASINNLASANLLLATANTERMRISSTGNVSIGNTNNTYKLDVTGDINISGVYRIAGTAYSVASATLNGFLTSTDWNTFNNKENAITAGTTAQYWRGDKTWQTLNTDAVVEATNLYFTNARAIGSVLTGYVSGAGTISATDTVLTAIQKLDGNIGSLVTGVSSVFGRTGSVTAQSGDYSTTLVTEGTNLYYTDARARGAISLTTTGTSGAATYNSTTGVLNIPQYQGPLANTVTGTGTANYLPKFTGSTTVGNSQVVDDGTSVLIGLTSRRASFNQGVTVEFQVEGLSFDTAASSVVRNSNDVGAPKFVLGKTRGTAVLSNTAVANGDFLGNIEFQGGDGTTLVLGSSIRSIVDGTVSTGNMPAALTFYTNGVGNTVTERMRIASNGKVGIGSTTLTDVNLRVSNNITGGTNNKGLMVDGVIQSDSTSSASVFVSQVSVQATAFTLPVLAHFNVNLGSPITTATVTNQYGVIVQSSMVGATNNYAFYSNLASATGSWNLYMNGTANNYMAGSLGIGSTSLTGINLLVSKNLTGATSPVGIASQGAIQSDATSTARYFYSVASTQATTFTLTTINHYETGQGTFGAGSTVTNQIGFFASSGLIGATNNYGFYGDIANATGRWNLYMTGTANNYMAGALGIGTTSLGSVNLYVSKNITGNVNSYGIYNVGTIQSDVTTTAYMYRSLPSTAAATFTLGALHHFNATQSTIGAGSAVTNQYGYFVDSTLTGATNNYGFYGAIASGANRYNIYMAGGANNYLGGSLGIGSTVLTGYSLVIGKNITGGVNSYGVEQSGTVLSDVTSNSAGFRNNLNTQAAAFTLGTYRHFYAQQSSIGAGSSVSNQYGFVAESNMVGATSNNWGFVGNLPSGANNWNLYMGGTANNYMAGSLGIGTTSIASINLRISKGITGGTIAYSVLQDSQVQSDVTSQAHGFYNGLGTVAATFTLSNYYHFRAYQGGLGAGSTVTNQYAYFADATITSATNNFGFYGNIQPGANNYNLYMNGGANNYLAGALGIGTTSLGAGTSLSAAKNITGATTATVINQSGVVQSDVTTTVQGYANYLTTAAAAFTLATYRHFIADQSTIGAGSAVTTQIGFLAGGNMIGATNNYGFFGNLPSGSGRYNIYMGGTAANYLAGNLGIGSTANVANTNIYVAKTITGGVNSYAVLAEGSVQSDVTTAAYYFRTTAGTQAATFTLPALYHFHAQQTTFGAGSTVTAQYGYSVASNLTSATNNYGFYGNLASATGVWNIYMAGTANNYLAGNLSIGTTTLTSEKLNVNGNIRIDNGAADGGQLILASLGFNDWNIDNFSGVFRAYYNATEYFRISATGNVSIGNTNNTYKLDVNGDVAVGLASTANKLRIARPTDANATAAYLGFESTTSNTDFTLANNSGSGNLVFKANSSEAMRIDGSNSNALYIGTTSTLGGAGKLQIVQPTAQSAGINIKAADILQAFYNSSGTLVGIIQHNGTNTSYGTSSDYRLKTDFKLFNGLDLLDKIKVYDFAWKSNKSRMFGVIAHELQEVLPYAVSGIKDGDMIQSADYSLIVPILVQSIKDLKEEIETLKNNK
jgi:hypothetical protein